MSKHDDWYVRSDQKKEKVNIDQKHAAPARKDYLHPDIGGYSSEHWNQAELKVHREKKARLNKLERLKRMKIPGIKCQTLEDLDAYEAEFGAMDYNLTIRVK